ncbi:FRG domain-containing protein [Gallionella capsiferriformans]|uniref:FRG domain protein n=1 Tax=Gallionella capsiferriformans (strain ES-2) TaxID=395494 RepID=D9SH41_GALCS|nr:FRG domain-containing protein [Gallionella capsiferriformans]ADL55838.1 FRG domain protein [Gallionella capsiferriformans ES-2]
MKLPAHVLLQLADQERAPIGLQAGGTARWTMVQAGSGATNQAKIMRNALSVALYRGQNQHFDQCWPSLCRDFQRNTYRVVDLAPLDQALLLKRLALNRWFADELTKHPMMKWAKSQNIFVDAIALAQHYGIPTAYIDVSESFQIAAFFATCRFVQETASWEPMTTGEGVIYHVHFNAIDERISPICYQPFPRPLRQWAWTVELRLGENFLHTPKLQGFRFDHDAKVGEEMLRRFDGGSKLLPPDPSARLASAMCFATEIPSIYIDEVEAWMASDPNGLPAHEVKNIRTTLKNKLGIGLSNTSAVSYTLDELNIAERECTKFTHGFFDDVGFRATLPTK